MSQTLPLDSFWSIESLGDLTEKAIMSNKELWGFFSRTPREIPRKPSLDSLVELFLSEHGINARKPSKPEHPELPSGSRGADALMGGAMGALGGPLAVGISSHLSQQRRSAMRSELLARHAVSMTEYSSALQEWTTWKHWALGHEGWKSFYDRAIDDWEGANKDALQSNDNFLEWLGSEDGLYERRNLLAKIVEEKERFASEEGRRVKDRERRERSERLIFSLALGVPIFIGCLLALIGGAIQILGYSLVLNFLLFLAFPLALIVLAGLYIFWPRGGTKF